MNKLSSEKCFNHRQREAVALCPECRRFFCRECVTEHDDRVICAACLRKMSTEATPRKITFSRVASASKMAAGFIFLWFFFFYFGLLLLKIPASVHDGSMWRDLPRESFQRQESNSK